MLHKQLSKPVLNSSSNGSFKVSSADFCQQNQASFKNSHILVPIYSQILNSLFSQLNVSDVNEQLVNDVVHIIADNKGKHSLVFNVVDHLNRYEVDLLSRKMKVNLNREFLEQISELNHLKLRIK